MPVLEAWVERKEDVVLLQEPQREGAETRISHSPYDIRTKKWLWMAVRNGRSRTMNEQTDFRRNARDDIIVVNITRTGENMIMIVNINNQRKRVMGERAPKRVNSHKIIRQGGWGHGACRRL